MKPHNFERILSWLIVEQPELSEVENRPSIEFQHDHWCGIWHGLRCDCQPNLLVGNEEVFYPKEIANQSG